MHFFRNVPLYFFLERTILAVPCPVKKTFSYFPNVPNFSSAKFNPVDPSLIVTANLINGVQLWDTRFPRRFKSHFDFFWMILIMCIDNVDYYKNLESFKLLRT